MNKKELRAFEKLVYETIKSKGNRGLTYGELTMDIARTRKEKRALSSTLKTLLNSGAILKDRKRFRPQQQVQEKKEIKQSKPKVPARIITGKFDATSLARDRSFAFVRTEERDYFVDGEDTLNAFHNDTVHIELKRGGEYGDRANVIKIIERANLEIPGSISKMYNRWIFVPSNPKIHKWFEITDIGDAKQNQIVILKVQNWGNPHEGKYPHGKIIEVLGPSDDPEIQLLSVIRQYGLSLHFPDTVLEEAKRISPTIKDTEIKRRLDLRQLLTFTIDPISAKDFDDAISIEHIESNIILWVHIADVSHYVRTDSNIFKEAVERGNSFYFPKRVIPMLPETLSNKLCSLRPNEDKLCLSVKTVFNSMGKIQRQSLHESVVRSKHRLSYEDVDEVFENKATNLPKDIVESLQTARILSKQLSQHRLNQGYIFFDLPDISYHYDDDGFMRKMYLDEETESHKLIENFMLVANEYVAKQLSNKAKTSIYRIHDDPDQYKIEEMVSILSYYGVPYKPEKNLNKSIQNLLYSLPNEDYHRVFDRIILRSMKKAQYSVQHIRHFGLSMEDYTHFTSPIRRLCDLVIHHLCKIHLLGSSKEKIDYNQLKRWASVSSEQELEADSAERDIQRIYNNTYMKDKIGEHFTGIVISVNSRGLIISLNEIPVTAMLKKEEFKAGNWQFISQEMRFVNRNTGYSYQLIDHVKVQIIEVSDDIYLKLANTKDAHVHPPRPASVRKKIKIDAKAKPKKSEYKAKNRRKRGRK
ncbi:MAG: ribonuclease R family protein [Candidatus Cloacimonadaceae bacterium]